MTCRFLLLVCTAVVLRADPAGPASDTALDQRLADVAAAYAERVAAATEQLNQVRERTAAERIPLVEANRALQQRVIALETELTLLRAQAARAAADQQQLDATGSVLRRNLAYLRSTAEEQLQALENAALPGERSHLTSRIVELRERLQRDAADPAAIRASMELGLTRLEQRLGGHGQPGRALLAGTNTMLDGHFAFVGPEAYFRSEDGRAGLLRTRPEAQFPVLHPLADWAPKEAAAFFAGEPGRFPADAQGGRALQLAQARGDWIDHVRKGGLVGYLIVGLGAIALVISLWKLADLHGLMVDEPPPVQAAIMAVGRGAFAEAEALIGRLRRTTREVLGAALPLRDSPKSVLEEHLYARILQLRLHHERRLPLLGVIVTASPLLGLLGTVTGMVTTFTLITVFGTGDAEKLSSGISEALVTTELGLMVAIPTLLMHTYLGHRVRKALAMLERYAIEFVTATDTYKAALVARR